MKIKIINTTTNSNETARLIAENLVKMNLSPCVQIIPKNESFYKWNGKLENSKEFIIKNGTLLRGLGGLESQERSNIKGVANFRSCSWNRAPIDRMANLNLEPGDSSFDDIISSVEKGIYLQTNRSWSIDDFRNKFQFGC